MSKTEESTSQPPGCGWIEKLDLVFSGMVLGVVLSLCVYAFITHKTHYSLLRASVQPLAAKGYSNAYSPFVGR